MTERWLVFLAALAAAACGGSSSTDGSGGTGTGGSAGSGGSGGSGASGGSATGGNGGGNCGDCGIGLYCCGDGCKNFNNDIKHCGGCGKACPGEHPFCDNGTCTTAPCDSGVG